MLGAIAGDIIGSVHEFIGTKTADFELFSPDAHFTDDSVLSIAVADCLLRGGSYVDAFHDYYARYPGAGFGGMFLQWAESRQRNPYNSFGNGSAMRVSAVGWAFDTLDDVLAEAKRSAEVTHNHPEGIRGAQATAASIFLARTGATRLQIRDEITRRFGYDLNRTVDQIRPTYSFDETCQKTVPEAIVAFLDSSDYEDAVRKAISLGGDADTLACITGGIAEAFYGEMPPAIAERAFQLLDEPLLETTLEFCAKYVVR
jgi:ADP-ribosylglycohydrolase